RGRGAGGHAPRPFFVRRPERSCGHDTSNWSVRARHSRAGPGRRGGPEVSDHERDASARDASEPAAHGRDLCERAALEHEAAGIHVIAAVIEREGRYLLARRPSHKRHGGLWEFPGGKLDEGEG